MSKSKFFGIIIGLLTCMHANAMTPINLCLTGKVELTLPGYKIAFLNAVNLALSKNSERRNIRLKTYFYDNKPLSAISVYNKMLHDRCAAIIGFEYLSDLLLVTTQQHSTRIPIFTSYASSSDSDRLPKNIFVFAPTYDYQAKKMMSFLRKKYVGVNNALLITEIDRADLSKYKTAYETLINQEKIHYDKFDFIGSDNQFESKLEKFILNKHYNFVFVFSGAVGSTKILNFMNDHKTIFIGTENFGSSTNQSLYVRLNDKHIKAFIIRNIDLLKSKSSFKEFTKKYFEKYHISPSPLSIYTYDAVSIILRTLGTYNAVNTDNILNTNYSGITGAYIKNNQFHRSSQYVILSIGNSGFIYEE